MSFLNLQDFLAELASCGQLRRVETRIDNEAQIIELWAQSHRQGGPALLFTRVTNRRLPMVTNLFGTPERVKLALAGTQPKTRIQNIVSLTKRKDITSPGGLWRSRNILKALLALDTRLTPEIPVLDHKAEEPGLLLCEGIYENSEHRTATATVAILHVYDLRDGKNSFCPCLVRIIDAQNAWINPQWPERHLDTRSSSAIPANLYLGGPPALLAAIGASPLPFHIPEGILAAFLLEQKLGLGRIKGAPVAPLAEAEVCSFGELIRPGPERSDQNTWIFRSKSVHHRRRAVLPTFILDTARSDLIHLHDFIQDVLNPILSIANPLVEDVWQFGHPNSRQLTAMSLHTTDGIQAYRAALQVLAQNPFHMTNFLIVTSPAAPVRNFRSLLVYFLERINWQANLHLVARQKNSETRSTVDYPASSAAIAFAIGPKIRELPTSMNTSTTPALIGRTQVFCPGCLVVEAPEFSKDPHCVHEIIRHPTFTEWPLIVAVDDVRMSTSTELGFLEATFATFDPGLDLFSANSGVESNQVCFGGNILIDSRRKT